MAVEGVTDEIRKEGKKERRKLRKKGKKEEREKRRREARRDGKMRMNGSEKEEWKREDKIIDTEGLYISRVRKTKVMM